VFLEGGLQNYETKTNARQDLHRTPQVLTQNAVSDFRLVMIFLLVCLSHNLSTERVDNYNAFRASSIFCTNPTLPPRLCTVCTLRSFD
jgi:hypothetical protein